jgi:acetoin utilization deacetylase AcuC-like enzyme
MEPVRVAAFFDERMLAHDTGTGFFELCSSPLLEVPEKHPENSDRLRNIVSVLRRGPLAPFVDWHLPHEATTDEMRLVHTPEHLTGLQEASRTGQRYGLSTVLPQGGWLGISLACGAALDACERVLCGADSLAYACVRPPGHHASAGAVDGYCFVNNTACAAAKVARAGHRVCVIDLDVHHGASQSARPGRRQLTRLPARAGNGCQSIFYRRSNILTVSMHMAQGAWEEGTAHPETGDVEELGEGPGLGFNVNVPLDLGSGDSAHLEAFEAVIAPEVASFKPTFFVIALGVDGSQMDPNGRQLLTMAGYFRLGRACMRLAAEHAEGRMVVVQEGGYSVSYAAFCVHAFLEGARGQGEPSLGDPLEGTYPDPPRRDPAGWRAATLVARLKQERAEALAKARAGTDT